MKNILLGLILILSTQLNGQVLDTTWFENVNNTLYQVNRVQYEDGTYNESRIITDTARVLTITARKIEGRSESIKQHGIEYSEYKKLFNQAILIDNSISSKLGQSPLANLQQTHQIQFTDTLSTWVLKNGHTTSDVSFSISPTGILRIKIGTQNNRNVVILGSMLRIANLGSTHTFMYKAKDGRWQDVDGNYILIRTQLRQPTISVE